MASSIGKPLMLLKILEHVPGDFLHQFSNGVLVAHLNKQRTMIMVRIAVVVMNATPALISLAVREALAQGNRLCVPLRINYLSAQPWSNGFEPVSRCSGQTVWHLVWLGTIRHQS